MIKTFQFDLQKFDLLCKKFGRNRSLWLHVGLLYRYNNARTIYYLKKHQKNPLFPRRQTIYNSTEQCWWMLVFSKLLISPSGIVSSSTMWIIFHSMMLTTMVVVTCRGISSLVLTDGIIGEHQIIIYWFILHPFKKTSLAHNRIIRQRFESWQLIKQIPQITFYNTRICCTARDWFSKSKFRICYRGITTCFERFGLFGAYTVLVGCLFVYHNDTVLCGD